MTKQILNCHRFIFRFGILNEYCVTNVSIQNGKVKANYIFDEDFLENYFEFEFFEDVITSQLDFLDEAGEIITTVYFEGISNFQSSPLKVNYKNAKPLTLDISFDFKKAKVE
jgi:hypothetical protein